LVAAFGSQPTNTGDPELTVAIDQPALPTSLLEGEWDAMRRLSLESSLRFLENEPDLYGEP
jgi:hypothetical protein